MVQCPVIGPVACKPGRQREIETFLLRPFPRCCCSRQDVVHRFRLQVPFSLAVAATLDVEEEGEEIKVKLRK